MEAVRLLRARARTPRQLAVELGRSEQTLRNWVGRDVPDLLRDDEAAAPTAVDASRQHRPSNGQRECRPSSENSSHCHR